uniref:HDC00290 n=1 Tax=Drosophila melanogaster TaxID=7227 RepID=Q6IHZ0_DROME|nr:TPA_inf: HDC00290 [Drosophila melanogaster]
MRTRMRMDGWMDDAPRRGCKSSVNCSVISSGYDCATKCEGLSATGAVTYQLCVLASLCALYLVSWHHAAQLSSAQRNLLRLQFLKKLKLHFPFNYERPRRLLMAI